jgi:hypothetical protein
MEAPMKTRRAFVGILFLAAALGCKNPGGTAAGVPEPRGPEPAVLSGASGATGGAVEEAEGPLARVPSTCPEGRIVRSGGHGTPEGVLWDAYRLALQPDQEATAAEFAGLVTAGTSESHVRRNLWPRVREHVGKLVADPGRPAYVLCRSIDGPGGRVKIFVKSNDPQKSDPPTVLVREDGVWKIDVMTP